MAEGWCPTAANASLDAAAAIYRWIQLHVGAPGAAATANVATNSTRKQVTWASSSGGAIVTTTTPQWTNVPAAEDYTHWSAWSAATAGTPGFTGQITANGVGAGDDFDIPASDLTASVPLAS